MKIAEIVGINRDILGESKNCIDQALRKQLEKMWYSNKEKNSQGKLKLYTSFKERPGFENCLNESNPKLRQAITKITISVHKFLMAMNNFFFRRSDIFLCALFKMTFKLKRKCSLSLSVNAYCQFIYSYSIFCLFV